MMEKLAYSVEEMATALGIGRSAAFELVHRADFPAVRVHARRIIIPIRELEQWLARQAAKREEVGS